MPSLASLFEKRLSPEVAGMLRRAGETAAEAGLEAYLVGGTVRDLVLGGEPKDPDIVVVGDAAAFSVRLAEQIGGKAGTPSEFGTTTVTAGAIEVDIATARSESYEQPGALPTVTPSNIQDDLRRRDFSVNAMAVSILPRDLGRLVDPANGFSDCARRRLRVLHPASFADDPTRALRAVRYMARLGFQLDRFTQEALERDVHHIDAVSGQRVRAELGKLLAEPKRVDMIKLADQLGILFAIEPSFRPGSAGLTALERAGEGRPVLEYVAYLVAGLTENEANALIKRLDPPKEWREVITAGHRFRAVSSILNREDLSPSEVVDLLAPFPEEALKVQEQLAPPTVQKKHIREYLQRYRLIKPDLTGDDLIALGASEGPAVGSLLEELKSARLDGKVHNRDEEIALAKRRLGVS